MILWDVGFDCVLIPYPCLSSYFTTIIFGQVGKQHFLSLYLERCIYLHRNIKRNAKNIILNIFCLKGIFSDIVSTCMNKNRSAISLKMIFAEVIVFKSLL